MCVSTVSLEINPLHLVFNEGPKKKERETEREKQRDRERQREKAKRRERDYGMERTQSSWHAVNKCVRHDSVADILAPGSNQAFKLAVSSWLM